MNSKVPKAVVKSGKCRHIAFCLLPQLLIVLFVLGIWQRGYWLLLPSIFLLVIIPLLDLITGWQDDAHFEKENFSSLEIALLHWNTRLYAIFYMVGVIYLVITIHNFNGLEIGMLIVASGLLGGIGFGAAHELLHAKEKIDQFLQRITTVFLFYPHYKLIHIRSHHVHTSTDHDENTAWFNESIYSYILRTIPGSMVRCWLMEMRRSVSVSIFKNKMIVYALGQGGLLIILYLISDIKGVLFYMAHIMVAHIVLESVNYIQHYGLMRKKYDGEYEKTGAEHSWDTYHYFSSYIAFRVGHHSYHHIAVKPYYLLATEAQAPKLPVGYFWAIPMVFLPSWWRRVINPKLTQSLS